MSRRLAGCYAILLSAGVAGCAARFEFTNLTAPVAPCDSQMKLEPAKSVSPAQNHADTVSPLGNPFAGSAELSAEVLIENILARNPSLAQMVAAWQAASARYPQVISLDDPMFGFMAAP